MIKDQAITKISTKEIWENFSHDLRAFVRSRLRNDEVVEDIIQEIFFKIHSNIDSLKDNSKLRSWIFQIARNAIIDFFRKEDKSQKVIERLKGNDDFNVDETADEILYFCMHHFISMLPDIYKEAIIYTEYENHTQIELAEKCNISISAAKSRVQRARIRIKELILEYSHIEYDNNKIEIQTLLENCPFCKK